MIHHSSEDRQWVENLLQGGDEQAFRQLYRRHTPRLYGFTLRLLGGDRAEAEDVVQETWVRAVRQLKNFRWQSSLATWLCGIAQNQCREQQRRRRTREEKQAQLAVTQLIAAPETQAPRPGGLRVDLEKAISRLPIGYRTVLVLHDLEGFTHREIARDLGISDGTSKSQLFEARKRVKTWLEGARHAGAGMERRRA